MALITPRELRDLIEVELQEMTKKEFAGKHFLEYITFINYMSMGLSKVSDGFGQSLAGIFGDHLEPKKTKAKVKPKSKAYGRTPKEKPEQEKSEPKSYGKEDMSIVRKRRSNEDRIKVDDFGYPIF